MLQGTSTSQSITASFITATRTTVESLHGASVQPDKKRNAVSFITFTSNKPAKKHLCPVKLSCGLLF